MSKILVIAELGSSGLHRMSLEALAAAQQLGGDVSVAVYGSETSQAAVQLAAYQVAKVYAVQHELLGAYTADAATSALAWLVEQVQPDVVLLPHTYQVRDFAPRLATRLGRAFVSDVIGIETDADGLLFKRQIFQGKLIADVRPASGLVFASVQAGAFRADSLTPGSAPIETLTPPLDAAEIRQKPEPPFREAAQEADLGSAEAIVAVGRGIQEESNVSLIQELAEAMGAELAASRPICDNGWLPMSRQVGSSGQTVAPKLYVAVGISGAIQHLVGMKGSKCIVAINKDPDAPIFEVADYGIAGDLFDVVPALINEIKKSRG